MSSIFKWMTGSVDFVIYDGFCERFISLCNSKGIALWNLKTDRGRISATTRLSDYRKMRAIRRQCHVKLKSLTGAGLPFFAKHNRKKIGFMAGAITFIAFFIIMSQFIWTIEITGNSVLDEADVLYALERNNIKIGSLTRSIDSSSLASRMYLELSELAWISFNQRGTTLYVEIKERTMPPEMLPQNTACNIVAGYSGHIKKLRVYSGRAAVMEGDAVLQNQLLVSGIVEDLNGQVTFTRARASVIAEIKVAKTVDVPYEQIKEEELGEVKKRYSLNLFNLKIPLYFDKDEPGDIVVEETRRLTIGGFEFPLGITIKTRKQTEQVNILFSREQAYQKALDIIESFENDELPNGTILERRLAHYEGQDSLSVTAVYRLETEIGTEREIGLD